jgi:hypothetical protein
MWTWRWDRGLDDDGVEVMRGTMDCGPGRALFAMELWGVTVDIYPDMVRQPATQVEIRCLSQRVAPGYSVASFVTSRDMESAQRYAQAIAEDIARSGGHIDESGRADMASNVYDLKLGCDPNEARDWYFTFGVGDEDNGGRYVVLHGRYEACRAQMFARFGSAWAFSYPSAEDAGVERWGLTRLDIDEEGSP